MVTSPWVVGPTEPRKPSLVTPPVRRIIALPGVGSGKQKRFRGAANRSLGEGNESQRMKCAGEAGASGLSFSRRTRGLDLDWRPPWIYLGKVLIFVSWRKGGDGDVFFPSFFLFPGRSRDEVVCRWKEG